jgi:hypothetical protein
MDIVCESLGVPKNTAGKTFIFILFGLTSLLAWNAILTELNFFSINIKIDPFQYFSFLNFFPNIILQLILLCKKDLFKVKCQLISGLIASIVLIIIIPLLIIFLNSYETFLNITIIALILIMGLINALLSSGFFAFVSFFPLEMIIALSTGQGFSGILMNVIKYIITFTTQGMETRKSETIGAIAVFSTTATILLICLITLLFSLKTDYFNYYLNMNFDTNDIGRITTRTDEEDEEDNQELIDKNKEMTFYEMFCLLIDIDILCAFIYIVTFAVYPVAFADQTIFNLDIYNFNTILAIYNVFDTLGRYLVSKINPTKKIAYISILSRTILIFTILFNYYLQKRNKYSTFSSIFLIINDSLLALSNGIGTTVCFGIAPTLVKNELKGQAGASVSFFTIFGIFLGAIIAIFTKFLLTKIAGE